MHTRPSQVVGNSMRSSVACGVSLEVPNAWESRVDKHRIKIPDTVVEGFSGLIASLFCGRLQESVLVFVFICFALFPRCLYRVFLRLFII